MSGDDSRIRYCFDAPLSLVRPIHFRLALKRCEAQLRSERSILGFLSSAQPTGLLESTQAKVGAGWTGVRVVLIVPTRNISRLESRYAKYDQALASKHLSAIDEG